MDTTEAAPPVPTDEQKPKWTDLFGIDPDYIGESCIVDYVRWSHGAEDAEEFDHDRCWRYLCESEDAPTP